MGWKSYGTPVQLVPVGSYLICAKPLAALAVIDPDWPDVASLMTTWRPCAVSCRVTARLSPELMNRSLVGSGVKVASVLCSGLGGAWVLPFLVTKAKVKVSMPTLAAHVEFCRVPLTGFSSTLKMFM